MNIDSIKNGIVIDHITAGKAMQLYKMLELDRLECCVAILQNVVRGYFASFVARSSAFSAGSFFAADLSPSSASGTGMVGMYMGSLPDVV